MDTNDPQVATVLDYFHCIDTGAGNPFAKFLPDAQVYFPKFGIGRGPEAWAELSAGLGPQIRRLKHHIDRLISTPGTVVVEGTTEGELADGSRWQGGHTPGGRFCSVFEMRGDQVARMHVYVDPDYAGRDTSRFFWGEDGRRW